MRTKILRFALIMSLIAYSGTPMAPAAGVGEAIMVRNDVKGTPPGGAGRAMATGDGIDLGLDIATGDASAIKMTFDPQGALSLGPSTKLKIDQPVVDRATGRSTSKLAMAVGQLRVAIGSLFGGQVEVTTPSAVVGIKGTVTIIKVTPSGETTVIQVQGSSAVKAAGGGDEVTLLEGTYLVVPPAGKPGPAGPIAPPILADVDDALTAYGNPPAPLPTKPDARLAGDAFGANNASGSSKSRFEVSTNSKAAGGSAFTDPRVGAFPAAPVGGFRGQCPPGTPAC